ncbi:MAG: putative Voltage-gated potassium channel [Dehalococcoidia bacterium]|nr:putative Voltage-gated potassium channel [Dehalococcoidia bacterium]
MTQDTEPTQEDRPLTRDDVLRLIKEHGRTARDLDLSDKTFEENIDLSLQDLSGIILDRAQLVKANLGGAILRGASLNDANLKAAVVKHSELQGANLRQANLAEADLRSAQLQRATLAGATLSKADLWETDLSDALLMEANLDEANLFGAELKGANIGRANLRGADLWFSKWHDAQNIEYVDWGDYIIGEELSKGYFVAGAIYRDLKQWHTQQGIYDRAGEFYYREMECRRKQVNRELKQAKRFSLGWWRSLKIAGCSWANPRVFCVRGSGL